MGKEGGQFRIKLNEEIVGLKEKCIGPRPKITCILLPKNDLPRREGGGITQIVRKIQKGEPLPNSPSR